MKITNILRPAKKSLGGVKVPHRKNTMNCETVIMPPPERVYIPVGQHIGAPCTPLVKKGDTVKVGQLIADSDKPFSAPIHASVSGTVVEISEKPIVNGQVMTFIVIESDGEMAAYEAITPPVINSHDDFIAAVRKSGLVGLGGAGFPASIKLSPPKDKKIDTLIINCAECEPYITCDYRECIENSEDILDGVYKVKDLLGVDRVIICVEDNKPEAIRILSEIAAKDDRDGDAVKIMKLASKYPQGAEKVMIYSATGRKVPAGKLPSDVGCVVMNITSVAFVSRYMKTGMPLVSKRITVDGSAVKNPMNVLVPIGTRLMDVVEFTGGTKCDAKKIINGGPMMGMAAYTPEFPVMKQTNALLLFDEKDARLPETTACIRCGKCINNCPMNMMPATVEQALKANDIDRLKKLSVLNCMECGSCSFGCPAARPLVQSMKLAKQKVR